jgi:PhzF family phenazine biosynthesis protein
MTTLRFKQVDVFTARPFFGNPVAVVIGAEGLDSAVMQRIAKWTNLSETTFLLKSAVADYKLRIFCPSRELPFAGHPTVGSAHAALESGFVPRKEALTQECGAGILDLTVEDGKIYVKGPQPTKVSPAGDVPGVALAAQARRVELGPVWIVGEVKDAAALGALQPDMQALARYSVAGKAGGVTLFGRSADGESAIHVRSFAPHEGIPEDPVCGSGNLSVAAYLQATAQASRFGKAYVARQGMQLGRDGRVHMRFDGEHAWLGGNAVTCVDGTLTL